MVQAPYELAVRTAPGRRTNEADDGGAVPPILVLHSVCSSCDVPGPTCSSRFIGTRVQAASGEPGLVSSLVLNSRVDLTYHGRGKLLRKVFGRDGDFGIGRAGSGPQTE